MLTSNTTTHPAFPSRIEEREFLKNLTGVLQQINKGVRLQDILNGVFESFSGILPYDRIGFSVFNAKEYSVRALWAKARYKNLLLSEGYSASLKGSSLEVILRTGKPRIIDNLHEYAKDHPSSESTQMIVQEGIRSSLTCPITHGDNPIGFIFFSSCQPNSYQAHHIEAFQWLAEPLALALDKAQLYEKLVTLNNEKNLLLGIAAHDLRSPIAHLQTMGQLLQTEDVSSKDRREIAGLIVARCQSMLTLLHDLLDLSAIEAGRLPLRFETFDLGTFCQSLVKGLSPLAHAKHITLKIEVPTGVAVVADNARLAQVVDNLLTNAIKYSPQNSTVTLTAGATPRGWTLSVADQGPGIAEKELAQLFKPFSKGVNEPTGGEAQFGLGLSIVKKIVDAHGGEVTVTSTLGQGTCFTLTMPKLGKSA